jgi:hypothetical protein
MSTSEQHCEMEEVKLIVKGKLRALVPLVGDFFLVHLLCLSTDFCPCDGCNSIALGDRPNYQRKPRFLVFPLLVLWSFGIVLNFKSGKRSWLRGDAATWPFLNYISLIVSRWCYK